MERRLSQRRLIVLTVACLAALGIHAGWASATPLSVRLEDRGFERIAREHGVAVFKHRTDDVIRLAAEARIGHPPAEVQRVLLDYRDQPGYLERLVQARVLEQGDHTLLVYQRLDLPVIDDRDFTLRVRWGQRDGLYWVRYRLANREGPRPRDGAVRVPRHHGSWQLLPVNGGQATFVRYEMTIDLGGWVPMWMARSGAGDEIPALFQSLRRMLD